MPASFGMSNPETASGRIATEVPYEDLFNAMIKDDYTDMSPHLGSLHDSGMTDAEAPEEEVPSSLEPNLTSPSDPEVSAEVKLPPDWPETFDPKLLTWTACGTS